MSLEKNIKKGLINPEIQGHKEKLQIALNEIKGFISEDINDLHDWINFLRMDFESIKRIKEENQWVSEHKELAKECGFVPENKNVNEIKDDIEKTKIKINTIKNRVEKLQSYSEHFKTQLEKLNALEKQFIDLVTTISPEQSS